MSTSFRYIAFEMGKGSIGNVNKIFNISLVLHVCLAILVVFFSEIFGAYYINNYLNIPVYKIDDALFVFRFSVYAVIFSILSIPFQGLVIAKEKFIISSTIEIVAAFLKFISAVILIYYTGDKLRLYASVMIFTTFTPSILYYLFCNKNYSSIIKWKFVYDIKKYREMLEFSGWMIFGATASIGKIQGAALIINIFFGTILNASFSIANQLNNFVIMFARNISQASIPQITKSYSEGNTDRTIEIVSYVSKYSFLLMLLMAVPILLETDFILYLWLGKTPNYTSVFCRLMIINALIDTLGAGIPAAVHATGRIKYFQIILSLVSLISIPVAYLLFIHGGKPYTIILVYIISSLISLIFQQILLKKLIHFKMWEFIKTSYSRIFYIILFIFPLIMIQILYEESFKRFLITTFISIFWVLSAIYFVGVDKKEKSFIIKLFKNSISY